MGKEGQRGIGRIGKGLQGQGKGLRGIGKSGCVWGIVALRVLCEFREEEIGIRGI